MPTITISPALRATAMSRSISGFAAQGIHAIDPYGRAWHAGMAARQIGGAVGGLLAGGADRRLPVIYPFIVNDPGEAAQAKRRIGAVTHRPSAAAARGKPRCRRIWCGWSNCSTNIRPPTGSIRRGATRLVAAIRDEARAAGVEQDLGLGASASAGRGDPAHRPLCLRPQGKPVRRRPACVRPRRMRRRGAGRAAARARGQARRAGAGGLAVSRAARRAADRDAISSRSIRARCRPARRMRKGIKLAEELLRRHLQDHGDWPKGLRGRPLGLGDDAHRRRGICHGAASRRRSRRAGTTPAAASPAIEIIPLAQLGRPRIDVTLARLRPVPRCLRAISRSCSRPASEALAARDFEGEENPYRAARRARVRAAPRAVWCRRARRRWMRSRARRAMPRARHGLRRRPGRSPRMAQMRAGPRRHRSAARGRRCFCSCPGPAGDRSAARRRLCRA